MSDTNNSGDKGLSASGAKATLHLKRPVEQGTVRQSFSHGRSKVVVVEKKRSVHRPEGTAPVVASASPAPVASPKPAAQAAPIAAPRGPTVGGAAQRSGAPPRKTGVILQTLTDEQREARARALADARAKEEEDRQRQEAEAAQRREREEREKGRARSRRSAQARRGSATRPGSQFQAPVGGRGSPPPRRGRAQRGAASDAAAQARARGRRAGCSAERGGAGRDVGSAGAPHSGGQTRRGRPTCSSTRGSTSRPARRYRGR